MGCSLSADKTGMYTIKKQRFIQMKYNQHTLQKIEKILDEAKYILRYERGSFQSGYCILEEKKVVILNKFLDVEGKINTLIELIPQLTIDIILLSTEAQHTYKEIAKQQNTHP